MMFPPLTVQDLADDYEVAYRIETLDRKLKLDTARYLLGQRVGVSPAGIDSGGVPAVDFARKALRG